MAEFGYHTIGGTTNANGGEFVLVSKETLPADGDVSKLTAYVDGDPNGVQNIRAVIYADSGGTPGALLGTGTGTSIAAAAPATWLDLVFPSPVTLAAGVYWIGYHFGGSANFHRYSDTLSNNLAYVTQTYVSGPPDPYGTPAGFTNERLSVYGTYDPIQQMVLAMQHHVFGHNVW